MQEFLTELYTPYRSNNRFNFTHNLSCLDLHRRNFKRLTKRGSKQSLLRSVNCLPQFKSALGGHPALSEAAASGSFGLLCQFVEAEGHCLDANPTGAAQQLPCDYLETQYWQAIPAPDGSHFYLTTEATPQYCLEALPLDQGGGGAKMAPCAAAPAQQWHVAASDLDYYYRLQNVTGGPDACLEGNRVAPGSFLEGAAFLDRCANVSGQLWRIGGAVPVDGIPVPLEALED